MNYKKRMSKECRPLHERSFMFKGKLTMISAFYSTFAITALLCAFLLLLDPGEQSAAGAAFESPAVGRVVNTNFGSTFSLTQELNIMKHQATTSTTTTTTTLPRRAVKPGRPVPPADSPSYEAGSISSLITQAFPNNPQLWITIAKCESGLNPNNYNREGASGLFQIMMPLHADMLLPGESIYDPAVNIRIALSLSHGGTTTSDWDASKRCWN